MGRKEMQALLASVLETIHDLSVRRQEAHDNQEEQSIINSQLEGCYKTKYYLLKKLSK